MEEQSSLELAKTILCISYLEEKIGGFYSVLSRVSEKEEVKLAFNYLSMDSRMRRDFLRRIAKLLYPSLTDETIKNCENLVGSKLIEALRKYDYMISRVEQGAAKKEDILDLIKWHVNFSGPEYLMMVNLMAFSFILKNRKGIGQVLKSMADGRKSRIEVLEQLIELMRSR